NKANKAAGLFNCIQSVDSVEIAAKLDSALKQTGRKLDVLVELKVSGEENKFGLLPDDLPELLDGLGIFKSLNIKGMMAMAPYFKDAGQARPYFRKAREAFLKAKKKDYGPNISMEVLSMGMSHDYKQAIEEGSTMVRIGSAIFGKREY
ncbi:MAG: YggS family pyridoxal phosphate-dependent enzyme, partial [Spirochaetia bacterium]|nr:YggS family pyridoxal phosphate-dependent enzyme [Spirochaetia bacterium]